MWTDDRRRQSAVRTVPIVLLAVLLASASPAQDGALEAFKDDIRAAAAAAARGTPGDLRAARDHLDAAEARIAVIAEPRKQDQARLFVAVRRADLLFRASEPNTGKAGELLRAARTAARAAGVWEGPYQESGLVMLWQSLPAAEFFALLEGAPDDLAALERPTPAWEENTVPLRLIRADLRLVQRREREAIAELTAVSALLHESATAGRAVDAAWADKCHDVLVWRLIERREYERAAVFVPFLRDATSRAYYAAFLTNQRGDYAATERALAGTRDARARLLLADALEQLGKIEAAAAEYAAIISDGAAGDELRAAAHNGLGDCYRRRGADGDRERARASYEQSLRALAGLSSRKVDSEVAENYRDLGLLEELDGAPAAAHAAFVRALAELEKARAGIPLDPFGAAFLEPQFLGAVDGVLRTWQAAGREPLEALVAVDRVKARSLLDRVASPRALEESEEVLAAVRELVLARDPDAVRRARLALEQARVAVGERAGLARPRPLAGDAMRAELAAQPDAVILAYWLGEARAWLVTARGVGVSVHDLGTATDAAAHVRAAHAAVARVEDGVDPWPALDASARFFLPAPALGVLRGAARVVFVPDDRLARLPFEALRVDGSSIGLACEVERAPSLAVRAHVRRRPAAHGPPLVVDSVPVAPAVARDFALDELRFSAREGDLVAGAWPGSQRLRGPAATLAGLREHLGVAPRLLHVSSHAVTHGVVPSSSLLLLADGAVPLSSLTELPLEGATVVLSACSTATGEARGGEGDAGLLWGPLGAGARSVVASLWQVNQQATCDLMGQVHHWLAGGASEAAALLRARRALAAASNYAHPHYWAGFAAFGSAEPAPSRDVRWGIALGACAVVLVAWWMVRRRAGPPAS